MTKPAIKGMLVFISLSCSAEQAFTIHYRKIRNVPFQDDIVA